MRLLSQVPYLAFTCLSVPSMSLKERTITVSRYLSAVALLRVSSGLADRAGEGPQTLVQVLGRHRQRGQQLHGLALRAGGLDQQAEFEGALADGRGARLVLELHGPPPAPAAGRGRGGPP